MTTFANYFKGTRILLAEDNAANQMVASEILTNAGFTVEVAGSGTVAVEKCRHENYAAVLMDVQMPEMDGIEATVQIRKTLDPERLPIIAMTANAMRGDRETCLAAGMNDYVSKPINSIELLSTLKKWIPEAKPVTLDPESHEIRHQIQPAGSSDLEKPPATLPGIDVAEGLRRLGVSWPTFRKMLSEFKRSQPREVKQLREALDAQDFDLVRLKAHSLAGIGGNIAAVALREACKALEKSAQLGDNKKIQTHWPELREEFERVIQGIAAIVESPDSVPESQMATDGNSFDLKALDSALQKLQKYIENFDPVGVESALASVTDAGIPAELKSQHQDLSGKIQDLDYAAAAAVLSAMQKTLHDIKGKKA